MAEPYTYVTETTSSVLPPELEEKFRLAGISWDPEMRHSSVDSWVYVSCNSTGSPAYAVTPKRASAFLRLWEVHADELPRLCSSIDFADNIHDPLLARSAWVGIESLLSYPPTGGTHDSLQVCSKILRRLALLRLEGG